MACYIDVDRAHSGLAPETHAQTFPRAQELPSRLILEAKRHHGTIWYQRPSSPSWHGKTSGHNLGGRGDGLRSHKCGNGQGSGIGGSPAIEFGEKKDPRTFQEVRICEDGTHLSR